MRLTIKQKEIIKSMQGGGKGIYMDKFLCKFKFKGKTIPYNRADALRSLGIIKAIKSTVRNPFTEFELTEFGKKIQL